MRTAKSFHTDRVDETAVGEADEAYETVEVYRVDCPHCAQSIALLTDEETLPEHALCATRWNPFGMTVCAGSGTPAAEAPPTGAGTDSTEEDAAVLLTLPEGLDWRTQPFSHAGSAVSRPRRGPGSR
jgi:hypothetical protein